MNISLSQGQSQASADTPLCLHLHTNITHNTTQNRWVASTCACSLISVLFSFRLLFLCVFELIHPPLHLQNTLSGISSHEGYILPLLATTLRPVIASDSSEHKAQPLDGHIQHRSLPLLRAPLRKNPHPFSILFLPFSLSILGALSRIPLHSKYPQDCGSSLLGTQPRGADGGPLRRVEGRAQRAAQLAASPMVISILPFLHQQQCAALL